MAIITIENLDFLEVEIKKGFFGGESILVHYQGRCACGTEFAPTWNASDGSWVGCESKRLADWDGLDKLFSPLACCRECMRLAWSGQMSAQTRRISNICRACQTPFAVRGRSGGDGFEPVSRQYCANCRSTKVAQLSPATILRNIQEEKENNLFVILCQGGAPGAGKKR